MSTLLAQVIEEARALPEAQLREVLDFVGCQKSKTIHHPVPQSLGKKALLEMLQQEG